MDKQKEHRDWILKNGPDTMAAAFIRLQDALLDLWKEVEKLPPFTWIVKLSERLAKWI